MPSVSDFKKAFDLNKGEVLQNKFFNFTLNNIYIQHKVKKVYNEYEFPLTLEYIGPNKKGSEENLIKLIKSNILSKNGKIVYSDYGSPYECLIEEPKIEEVRDEEEGTVFRVDTKGVATRRRDIPTLKQQRVSQMSARSKSRGKSKDKKDQTLQVFEYFILSFQVFS